MKDITQNEMISCEDCGIVFENLHDLQKHIKTWCPEQQPAKRDHDYESPPEKRIKLDKISNNEDREQNVFEKFAEMSREGNEDQWQAKVEKYQNGGMSQSDAKDKATKKLKDEDLKIFMGCYKKLLSYWLQLRHGKLHTEIMDSIENFIDDNVEREKAIRLTLRKYKHYFEEFLVTDSDTDDDAETDENSDSDEDSENDGKTDNEED